MIFIKVLPTVTNMTVTSIMNLGLKTGLITGKIITLKTIKNAVKKTLVLLVVLPLAVYSIRAITFMTRTKANVSATA